MGFESVYRVSRRNALPTIADVDALVRALGMDLPLGYREYITEFGPGTLSDFVVVHLPSEINATAYWDRLSSVAEYERDECVLAPDDIENAVAFAHAAAEAPIWIASKRFGGRLFEAVEGDVTEIQDGFFGLVGICTARGQHEFPFFEPRNGRRRMRVFAVRPGIGRSGVVDRLGKLWGRDDLRCSRTSSSDENPHYFVPAIEGHIELLLWKPDGLPQDSFYVRARYDVESEGAVSSFAEELSLPGGGRNDFVGESF